LISGLIILVIIGVMSFIIANAFVFSKIYRNNPSSLRPLRLRTEKLQTIDNASTFNWNLIRRIILECLKFATGIFILCNLLTYLIFGVWYVDSKSVVLIVIVFAITLFQDFDKFVTSLLGYE
jgi:hypothetical protein